MRNTIRMIQKMKSDGEKISMLTSYDYTTAKLLDNAGIDMLLIGDSLGMVVMGNEDTISVSVEDIIHHSKAVARGTKNAFLVADLPFLSYQVSIEKAVQNAGRLMKEGMVQGVKLEGGVEFAETIKAITRASIPVVGHIGLTPQSIHTIGGFKVQGKGLAEAKKLIQDALAIENAGAFAIVLECVPSPLAELITRILSIPTIGIGAGNGTDGQVLVIQDMLGMNVDFQPKFVKKYADLATIIHLSVQNYKKELDEQTFPDSKLSYSMNHEVIEHLVTEFEKVKDENL